jgi:hypothetical protein
VSEDERFEAWLENVCQRPLSTYDTPMLQAKTLAKEIAEGAAEGFWKPKFLIDGGYQVHGNIAAFITRKWNLGIAQRSHWFEFLISNGYLVQHGKSALEITPLAIGLVNEPEPTSIFISYRRKDSSAFALLILKELKTAGLEAFLDLSLEPGEDWHKGLKERIQSYDYFILVLGKETLESEVVLDEIAWAIEAGLTIIPVWHGGFAYQAGDWGTIPANIDRLLHNTHAIRVREESALDYNTAIVELLNRFGVTP